MDVNESIVKMLESVGVDHFFGGSGQVNGSMLLALKKSEKIKTVIIRNEQAASFMACGYAMFSDKLGVCFSTGGPGEFNLFSGLAVALSDSLPVLAISGYTSARIRGKGALNESTGRSRTPDSPAMFAATTKKTFIIEKPEQTCDIIEEAVNLAFQGRPGPVHVHVPKDVTVMEVPNFRPIELKIEKAKPRPEQLEPFVAALAAALNRGDKIAALVGYGVIRSHAEAKMLELVERYRIPFMSTMDAKGALPEDHPLSLGVYGTSGDPGAQEYFDACSLVLAVGNSFAENATFSFREDLYQGKTLLHVNIDPVELGKVYKPDYPLLSDAGEALAALSEKLAAAAGPLPERPLPPRDKYYDRPVERAGDRVHPAELVKALSESLPEGSIVLGDAGAHMLWLNCYLNLARGQRYQNPGSFGPMASHVNGAIGIKCANPDKVVISGCGDGGYLMAGFELLTAVENDIPVVWVIFNNGEFNIIRKFLLNVFGQEAHMQFRNPDYVAYARACGAEGLRVERIEEFKPALERAIRLNKPVLIDVAVEKDVFPPFKLAKV